MSKPVWIDGVKYESYGEASREIGVGKSAIGTTAARHPGMLDFIIAGHEISLIDPQVSPWEAPPEKEKIERPRKHITKLVAAPKPITKPVAPTIETIKDASGLVTDELRALKARQVHQDARLRMIKAEVENIKEALHDLREELHSRRGIG